VFELLILIIGIAFGYLRKGKEDFRGLLKTGAIIGIVLAVLFGLVAFLFAPGAIGLGLAPAALAFSWSHPACDYLPRRVFIGDWLEGMQK
jgi:4-hydroxybenzoate polyprenyltransferase